MPRYSSNSAMRSGLEAQFSFMTELTRRSFDGLRALTELNLQLVQTLVADAAGATRQMLACSDPLNLSATMVHASQPALEHWRHYQQQLGGVFSGIGLDLARQAAALKAIPL